MTLDAFRKFIAHRKLSVDLLAIFFGIGAWVGINGMYVQLPLMVKTQPEAWNLPSYLSIVIQIGNIGPISYSLLQQYRPSKSRDRWLIYGLLSMGCISLLLMSFLYQKTTFVGEAEHSTSLLTLVFFLALVGCTSSVLFMPFMKNFKGTYLISYYVGESLSGFLPSAVALIQGVGGNPTCVNKTVNGTTLLTSYTPPPSFSTESFYIFLFCMLSLSNVSFFMLNKIPYFRSEMVSSDGKPTEEMYSSEVADKVSEESRTPRHKKSMESHPNFSGDLGPQSEEADVNNTTHTRISRKVYVYYLVLVSWLCFFSNGLFPSIQSYSCLPYGNVAYHLAITLGGMAHPLTSCAAFVVPFSSVKVTSLLAALCTSFSVYIAATAVMSPTPPLVNTAVGVAFVVIAWIFFNGLISYIKVSVACVLRREDGKELMWCGAVQQLASFLGSIVGFSLINYSHIFHSYKPCT